MKIDPLQSQLKDDAARSARTFSPVFHEKIMASLRALPSLAASAAPTASRLSFPSPTPHRWLRPLAAAALLFFTVTLYIALRPTPIPTPHKVVQLPNLAAPLNQFLAAAAPAADSLNQAPYAHLDQDAQHLMLFVADQFPTPPAATQVPRRPAQN